MKKKTFAKDEKYVSDIDDESDDTGLDETNLDDFKGKSIEVRGEGSRLAGKILQIKETKNSVMVTFKNIWGETEQLDLYFDEFEELKANKRVHTMDGEISIK
jgi:hypothetical protein